MSRSKRISLGFQVVDTRSGEALSRVFARREPARTIAKEFYAREPARSIGVRQLQEYVAADASKEEIALMRNAVTNEAELHLPPGTVRG